MKKLNILFLFLVFAAGALFKTAMDAGGVEFVHRAYADVAGMDYRDLRRDRDFRRAVQYIVEGCSVDEGSISC